MALLLMVLSLTTAVTLTAPRIVRAAAIRYAAPSAQGSGDCSSWGNACTLQTALTSAVSAKRSGSRPACTTPPLTPPTAPPPSPSRTLWQFTAALPARRPAATSATGRPTPPFSAATLTRTTSTPTATLSPRRPPISRAATPTTSSTAAARIAPLSWTALRLQPDRRTDRGQGGTVEGLSAMPAVPPWSSSLSLAIRSLLQKGSFTAKTQSTQRSY